MEKIAYDIHHLRAEDVNQVYNLTSEDGWSCTLEEIRKVYESYSTSWIGAFDLSGKLLSTCLVAKLDNYTGFVSFYITKAEHRGKGIGRKVWDTALGISGNLNLVLNARYGKATMYKTGGFKSTDLIIRKVLAVPRVENIHLPSNIDLRNKENTNFEDLYNFEDTYLSIERRLFLRKWMECSHFVFRSAYSGDKLCGYGIVAKLDTKSRLNGLYADNIDIAKALLKTLYDTLPEQTALYCYIPSKSKMAVQLLEDVGMASYLTDDNSEERLCTKDSSGIVVNWDKVYGCLNLLTALV